MMNESTGQRIRRGMNFLSMLGAKLRDLQGTATLAHELIQNAEDAVGRIDHPDGQVATMTFRLDERVLIVENEGVFTDCGDPHRQPCEWETPCDFHGFTDVGSGRKRLEEKQKGAFGFGFTAVYQMTDHPEVISSGRHWILEDEKPEDQRIFECGGCDSCRAHDLPGTRFILPWAYDRDSAVRQALKVAPVSSDGPQKFLKELLDDLPHTLLFLDHIRTIKVYWKDQLRLNVSRQADSDCPSAITIVQNGTATRWMILSTDFEDAAIRLRATHPPGEKKPISTVKIAVPNDTSELGLFFAFLPTQQPTGFPFHINADFFPTNDRKRILLESDYQADWNRQAIRTAAIALKKGLLELRSFLGPKAFWQLLDCIHHLSTVGSFEANPLCKDYWKQLVPALQTAAVIPTANGGWRDASQVHHVRGSTDNNSTSLYRALTIDTVHPEVRQFGALLTSDSVGVRELDAVTLAKAFRNVGVTGTKQLSQMPLWFQQMDHWEIVWSRLKSFSQPDRKTEGGTVWERVGDDWKMLGPRGPHYATLNPLAQCALVQCTDGRFRSCCEVHVLDQATRELFETLNVSVHFADGRRTMIEAVDALCDTFTLEDAVSSLESTKEDVLKRHYLAVLKWLCARFEELSCSPNLVARVTALPICPTASGLRPFSTVVLPGGFADPIGVTDLVDEKSLSGTEPLLRTLGLSRLSLREYITERLPEAFSSRNVNTDACGKLLELLAEHQGEYLNDEEIREGLASIPFIPCDDGRLRSANDGLYFETELVQDVLEHSVSYVSASYCTTAIQSVLTWLGVASEPDLDRVADYVIAIASATSEPTSETAEKVLSLFEHLGSRLDEFGNSTRALERLHRERWLPASGREWSTEAKKWVPVKHFEWSSPHNVHLGRRHYLVESNAQFIRFPTRTQDQYRAFLSQLGVVDIPNAIDVVRHLKKSAELGAAIDRRLYQFLDKALDDGELTEQQFQELRNVPCLYDSERQSFVKPRHCFSEKHVFGAHRVQLTEDTLSTFTNLLMALSVRSAPTWEDAIEVLGEISDSELVHSNRAITDTDKPIVMACWRMIESALRDEEEDREAILNGIEKIAHKRVVCRPDNLMAEPEKVFFRDREHLAAAFSTQLGAALVPIPQRAAEVLAYAGVRKLSEVTTTQIVTDEQPPQASFEVTSRLQERASLLIGVMETCKASRAGDIPDFEGQAVYETAQLTVKYSFNGFARPIPSDSHAVLAVYDAGLSHLYYCREEGTIPWDAIACELARMFLGTGDIPQLSAQISAVLEPDTLLKAKRKLSRLGFPHIELADDEIATEPVSNSFGLGNTQEGQSDPLESATGHPAFAEPELAATLQAAEEPSQPAPPQGSPAGGLGDYLAARKQGGIDTSSRKDGKSEEGAAHTRETGHRRPAKEQKTDTSGRVFAPIEPVFEEGLGDFDGHVPFTEELAARKGGTERRRDKISADSELAERRRSEQVWRQQRVNRIPKSEVEHYLRHFYSRDGHLHCQMRALDESDLHRMPFRKKNGDECWVCVELLNGKWAKELTYTLPEYRTLFILLCPNCAALYAEYVRNFDSQQDRLFEWFANSSGTTEFDVKCSLRGTQPDRVLHFDPKHLDDIRAVRGVMT